jgi:hypothetical protein
MRGLTGNIRADLGVLNLVGGIRMRLKMFATLPSRFTAMLPFPSLVTAEKSCGIGGAQDPRLKELLETSRHHGI